jgi:hypothetical protein
MAALAAILPLLLAVLSCGVKTHPYPEAVTLPGKVLELKGELDAEGQLTLSWKAPEKNMAGRPLQNLQYYEIRGADYDRDDFCAGCPSFFHKVGEVYGQPAPPGLLIHPGPYFWTTKLREGRVYRFQVAGFSERGAAHPESWSEVTVLAIGSPGELQGFRAALDDRSVRLYYNRLAADEEVEIERRVGDGAFGRIQVGGTGDVDLDVAYGNTYSYRGRKVLVRGGGRAPGPWSQEATVQVEDLLPPRPVGYLDASLAEGGIILKWESLGVEDGIRGYRLYRREGDAGTFAPIGGLLEGSSYLDLDVVPGGDYRYQVTAVDDSPRSNESLPSPEARVEAEAPQAQPEKPDLSDLGY